MWIVTNKTLYSAGGGWVQDKDANQIWLVVLKATFDILPDGSTRRAASQVPVFRMAEYQGEFAASSLIYESDLAGLKAGTDIVVNGQAWAPDGKPSEHVDVRVKVGPIDKSLRVFGDRKWMHGIASPRISQTQPFASMPITFERAFGGWDRSSTDPAQHRLESRNPVGTGFSAHRDNCRDLPLPNVEYVDQLIRSWNDHPQPAGLGAIDCSWSPRRELAGTYDKDWLENRMPLWAKDFDTRYNNSAPADQQTEEFLKGGEEVTLSNLSPNGTLVFSLPRLSPFFRTRIGSDRIEHRAKLCTVVIEPDAPRVILSWQTSLVCNHDVDDLDETVVALKRVMHDR